MDMGSAMRAETLPPLSMAVKRKQSGAGHDTDASEAGA